MTASVPPEVPVDVREKAVKRASGWFPQNRAADAVSVTDAVIAALSPWMDEQIAAAEQRGREMERDRADSECAEVYYEGLTMMWECRLPREHAGEHSNVIP